MPMGLGCFPAFSSDEAHGGRSGFVRVTEVKKGDRVVIPFVTECGECFFCTQQPFPACETNNPDQGGLLMNKSQITPPPALFGYSHLYGAVSGAVRPKRFLG